ncbi:MAG: glycoside hydrolase family 2 TIM barrel-domain containing protein, partial [Panacibacter sp.]
MKKLILLRFMLITSFFSSYAQDDEIQSMKSASITPFTGVDYVRIVINREQVLSPSSTFKAIIKSQTDGKILWQGSVTLTVAINEGGNYLAFTIKNLKPILWTPNNPYLYEITLQQFSKGTLKSSLKERAGFRSFERKGGNLYLNGKPIFLRGIAINPPGRGIPTKLENSREFAWEYIKFMKSINVNIIRIPDAEEWFDVCDELGMMVFGGNYSGKVAGGEKVDALPKVGDETDGGFPNDYDKGVAWYE